MCRAPLLNLLNQNPVRMTNSELKQQNWRKLSSRDILNSGTHGERQRSQENRRGLVG
jgi:hypothetical protein